MSNLNMSIALAKSIPLCVEGCEGQFSEIKLGNVGISETSITATVLPYSAQTLISGGTTIQLADMSEADQATVSAAWDVIKSCVASKIVIK